jgi:hypothetical protein
MRRRIRVEAGHARIGCALGAIAVACGIARADARAQSGGDTRPGSDPVVTTDRFELRSDPLVNLHHFLVTWASADADEWPPYATPIVENDGWRARLSEDEVAVWDSALETYAASRGRSYVFDGGLIALRDWAAGAGGRARIPEMDQPMAEALESALPIYVRHWWDGHDAENRAWIESLAPRLAEVEEAVVPRVEAAYGGRWPDARVPVDVVLYANDVGAYSTMGRLTISARDIGQPDAAGDRARVPRILACGPARTRAHGRRGCGVLRRGR